MRRSRQRRRGRAGRRRLQGLPRGRRGTGIPQESPAVPSCAAGSPTRDPPRTPCPLPAPGADEANPSVLGPRDQPGAAHRRPSPGSSASPRGSAQAPCCAALAFLLPLRSLRRVPLRPLPSPPRPPRHRIDVSAPKVHVRAPGEFPAMRRSRAARRGAPGREGGEAPAPSSATS
ncbi:sterile alpha motif domain-containing protein 1-like [Pezoporus occidentalis]|uniref:sterile alpha motif domain-containing protein 1-like n=1 Tax=Pezoporus occidentalis TaxID=407982 RepID=UPI002F90C5EE